MFSLKAARDPAVAYSLLFKAWQAAAGIIGVFFIATTLQPASQGYYYTFASLIALQAFFELGLYLVLSVSASHEWARLRLAPDGHIVGDSDALSRLISLGRFVFRWYGVASLLFLVLAAAIGLYFFGRQEVTGVSWCLPWLLHVFFSAMSMWLMPFLSLLEGCDQVASSARFRLAQSLVSSVAFWGALAANLDLWSVPVFSGASLVTILCYLGIGRREFFSLFFRPPLGAVLTWRNDLFPMQWRLGLQGLVSYMSFPFYTALIFAVVGPGEAGRMGMTLQIVGAIQSMALVLLTVQAPSLAIAIARGDGQALHDIWRQATLRSFTMMVMLVILFFAGLHVASVLELSIVGRVLSGGIFAVLAAGSLCALVVQCLAVYLRAHKQERLTAVGLSSGVLYGVSAWVIVPYWGADGVAATYLAVTMLITLPWAYMVFRNKRREWSNS